MMRSTDGFTPPPDEWVELLSDHHHQLSRVQVRWRRGNVPYRPIIPVTVDCETLRSERDWNKYELEGTHFLWEPQDAQTPEQRLEWIEEIVERLWEHAAHWAASRGGWCDFQLLGFVADDDQPVFECGRRCQPEDDPSEFGGGAKPNSAARPCNHYESPGSQREYERRLKDNIEYADSRRDRADERAAALLDNAHGSWRLVNEAMRDTHDRQREQLERERELRSGFLQLKTHALTEMEDTIRLDKVLGFLDRARESVMCNVVPLANRLLDVVGTPFVRTFAEFKCAQQAISYLVTTLNARQLLQLWGDDNRKAAGGMRGAFDSAAQMNNERDALYQIARFIPMLAGDPFRDVADAEQQIAARYIISRFAAYRMTEFGDKEEPADGSTTQA